MSYVVRSERRVEKELQRIARTELGRAAASLRDAAGSGIVHDARKRVKKVRAVVTLIDESHEGCWTKEQKRLREVGRVLSELRDADAIIETFDGLRTGHPRGLSEHGYAAIRRQLTRRRTEAANRASGKNHLQWAARRLEKIRRSAKAWPIPSLKKSALPGLVKQSFRASRKAMKIALTEQNPNDLHDWRKRVKTLWYQLRLLRDLAPDLDSRIESLDTIAGLLGDDHNLEVLCATVADDRALEGRAADLHRFTSIVRAQQAVLRRKTFTLGRRLHSETGKTFARSVGQMLAAPRTGPRPGKARQRASA
jgi:CHAD domain-containing protein